MRTIDLNCDCGEGFGAYAMGDDAQMLDIVTSASVACGFHAGDPDIMAATFTLAKEKGVAIGAHPGFADLAGFGRRRIAHTEAEIERLVAYQIGAAQAVAQLAGHAISYVKPHGALSNIAMKDEGVARAIARGTKAVDPGLMFLAIASTELAHAGVAEGLRTIHEIYADRAYTSAGHLAPRSEAGAVLHDAKMAAKRVLRMVDENAVISMDGRTVPLDVESICVHGDTPGAVTMAREVRAALENAGVTLRAFAD